jgi:hypothetical protein
VTPKADWGDVMTWPWAATDLALILATTFWLLSFELAFKGSAAIVKQRIRLTRRWTWTGWRARAVGFVAAPIGLAIIVLGCPLALRPLWWLFSVVHHTEPLDAIDLQMAEYALMWLLSVPVAIIGFMVVFNGRIRVSKTRLLTGKNAAVVGAVISIFGLMMALGARSIFLHG